MQLRCFQFYLLFDLLFTGLPSAVVTVHSYIRIMFNHSKHNICEGLGFISGYFDGLLTLCAA